MRDINLKQIIEQFPDCVTDGAKLKAILLDTYPEISKAIVNTLVIMANSGIAKEIQDSENITKLDKSRWQKKLEDDYGLSEKVIRSCFNIVSTSFYAKCDQTQNRDEIFNQTLSTKSNNILSTEKSATEESSKSHVLDDFIIVDNVLIKYNGKASVVTIPDCVKSIGYYAFGRCNGLTSIIIPDSVTSISKYSFYTCSELASITIPNSVTSIGENAFSCCGKLTNVTIGNGVTSIDNYAFAHCGKLKKVVWNAENCITAGSFQSIFSGCDSLVNVSIGENVKIIPAYAFV